MKTKIKRKTKEKIRQKTRKKSKKNVSVLKVKSSGDSTAAFEFIEKNLESLDGKKGFEIYKCYRDLLINIISEPEKLQLFFTDDSCNGIIDDFQLFDPAYKDNFLLCAMIKVKAPEIYEESVKTIDQYIRPEKRNEGLNHLYQECGGLLALLLQHYEGISRRQAFRAAAKFTKYSVATIEKSYRSRIIAIRKKLNDKLPPPLVLAMLYWTLHARGVEPDKLEPFKMKSVRSRGEIQKTIAAYWRFTEKVVRHYQKDVLLYLQKNRLDIVHSIAKEMDVIFPLSDKEMKKAPAFAVFLILCAALFIEALPDVLKKYDKIAKQIA